MWSPLQGEGCSVDSAERGTEGATVHVCILADMMFSLVCRCHHASRKWRPKRHRAWAPGLGSTRQTVCYSYSVLFDNIITLSFPYYATESRPCLCSPRLLLPATDGSGVEHREALRLLRPPSLPQKVPVNWALDYTFFVMMCHSEGECHREYSMFINKTIPLLLQTLFPWQSNIFPAFTRCVQQ